MYNTSTIGPPFLYLPYLLVQKIIHPNNNGPYYSPNQSPNNSVDDRFMHGRVSTLVNDDCLFAGLFDEVAKQ